MGIRKIAGKISGMNPLAKPRGGIPEKPQIPKVPKWQLAVARVMETKPMQKLIDRLDKPIKPKK